MKAIRFLAPALCATLALGASAQATGPVIYPAKGQLPQQQDRDRYECHDWARAQFGFDPTQPAQSAPAAQPAQANAAYASTPGGPSLGTMARGAAGGAAVAEVTNHDAGRGAAIGLLSASALSRAREQQMMAAKQQQAAQQQAQQQQALQQQQAARGQARAFYDRGFAACMEARGYVVK